MLAKATVFTLFAQALLIQLALGQVCGRTAFVAAPSLGSTYGLSSSGLTSSYGYNALPTGWSGSGLTCDGLAYNAPAIEITPITGGVLRVTSVSAPESSLVIASENVYEGTLAVEGELPFVGTVGLEGVMPSAGSGAVNHGCGNGVIRMISQDGAAVSSGLAPAAALAPGSLYGGIGALGNADALLSYDTGLAGLIYPNAGLVGAYPINGFAGAYHCASVLAPSAAYGSAMAPGAAYGGTGEGNVAIAGELPVTGNTAVAGQVPIMGVVRFDGKVPAAGTVVISGKCACGCRNPYVY